MVKNLLVALLFIASAHTVFAQEAKPKLNFFYASAGLAVEDYARNNYSSWLSANDIYTPRYLYGPACQLIWSRKKFTYGIDMSYLGRTSSTTFVSGAMGFTMGYPFKRGHYVLLPQVSTGWQVSKVDFRGNLPPSFATNFPGENSNIMGAFSWYVNPHVDFIIPLDERYLIKPCLSITIGYRVSIFSQRWQYYGRGAGDVDFIPKPSFSHPYISINVLSLGYWKKK